MARLLRLACRGISNADQASITGALHELFGSVETSSMPSDQPWNKSRVRLPAWSIFSPYLFRRTIVFADIEFPYSGTLCLGVAKGLLPCSVGASNFKLYSV